MFESNHKHILRREIVGNGLQLRALRSDDIDAIYEAVVESGEDLLTWITWYSPDYCKADTRQFVEEQQQLWDEGMAFSLGIFDPADGCYCGSVGLNAIDHRVHCANLGYWVRSTRAGSGIASRSARLLALAAFEDLSLERIEIVAAVRNHASQRAAEKAGALREAVLRQRLRTHSGQTDAICFSLVRADFDLAP